MPRPTESEKKKKATKEICKGKIYIRGKEVDVDIEVETKPNGVGYDTIVKLPVCPLVGKGSNQQ